MSRKKTQEVAVVPLQSTQEVASVESFIVEAIKEKLPVETMERLFALRKEVKATLAQEAFVVAMSNFQANCPIINKNKNVFEKNSTTKVRYSYASLDSIVSQVKESLGKAGLSYSTTVVNETGFIIATCKITHLLGHFETSSFKIPIDTEGYMSAPQKYASALTFAKRYAFCNALGILTGEDDVDAGDVGKKPEVVSITSAKGKIMFLLKELGVKVDKVDVAKEIKKLVQMDVKDDVEVLEEIKGRLEVLVQEKKDSQA